MWIMHFLFNSVLLHFAWPTDTCEILHLLMVLMFSALTLQLRFSIHIDYFYSSQCSWLTATCYFTYTRHAQYTRNCTCHILNCNPHIRHLLITYSIHLTIQLRVLFKYNIYIVRRNIGTVSNRGLCWYSGGDLVQMCVDPALLRWTTESTFRQRRYEMSVRKVLPALSMYKRVIQPLKVIITALFFTGQSAQFCKKLLC